MQYELFGSDDNVNPIYQNTSIYSLDPAIASKPFREPISFTTVHKPSQPGTFTYTLQAQLTSDSSQSILSEQLGAISMNALAVNSTDDQNSEPGEDVEAANDKYVYFLSHPGGGTSQDLNVIDYVANPSALASFSPISLGAYSNTIAVSADYNYVYGDSGTAFDLNTLGPIVSTQLHQVVNHFNVGANGWGVIVSPNNRFVVFSQGAMPFNAVIFDLLMGPVPSPVSLGNDGGLVMAVSPNSRYFASIGRYGNVQLVDLVQKQPIDNNFLAGPYSLDPSAMAFSQDSQTLFIGSGNDFNMAQYKNVSGGQAYNLNDPLSSIVNWHDNYIYGIYRYDTTYSQVVKLSAKDGVISNYTTIPSWPYQYNLQISPDKNWVVVQHAAGVQMIPTSTDQWQFNVPINVGTTTTYAYLAITPDSTMAYASYDNVIYPIVLSESTTSAGTPITMTDPITDMCSALTLCKQQGTNLADRL
ncbi:hypothetical protein J40TS1_30230 [Paenibacillus montaniterrae]|uniref:Uncharacterized protein n=1 Tax=Paenibacillus montaniterrae TaxID=429341 RepID=A0A919YU81_9BACL|nr:hypothetical protein J40TS1_30230 [Paenibacillus montaniterrae]